MKDSGFKQIASFLKRLSAVLVWSCLPAIAEEQEFRINLKDPVFSQGVIRTDQGGIIESSNLRIQAEKIEYTNRIEQGLPVKKVVAEGNLLLEYDGHAFIGSKLEYDFVSQTGTVWDGRTTTEYWFVGGDEIELRPDGSFLIVNAFLTTVEGKNHWWELRSSKININNNSLLTASSIKFKFFKVPIFWLPSFKFNLKWAKDPPVRYEIIWDQLLKQRISMRYEIYSSETFRLYGRLQYQFKYGPGAAIETDYYSADKRTVFQTKNFGAFNKFIPQEKGDKRFRLQGIYATSSEDERTHAFLSYDRLSDDKMPQDFKSNDFELNTQKRTILWITHQREDVFTRFNLQPRINPFQSINQQLPLVITSLRPISLGETGLTMDNWFGAGYLDYIFTKGLQKDIPATKAGRFETNNTLRYPFSTGPIHWAPYTGLIGIFYTNTPQRHATGQLIGSYGFQATSRLSRQFSSCWHQVESYLRFQGYSHPTSPPDKHFIFSLEDGYTTTNVFRPGIRQSFYLLNQAQFAPAFAIDAYTYTFVGHTAFHRTVPKLYADFEINRPIVALRSQIVYNMQELLFDRANVRLDWTVNERFAFGMEMRHRSRYDWRKADPDNFIMEIERPIDLLLHTPISDGRNTFLSRVQMKLSPLWSAHFESHTGWGRRNEPSYNAFEIKLGTVITGNWHVEFGLSFDPAKKWQAVMPSIKLLR